QLSESPLVPQGSETAQPVDTACAVGRLALTGGAVPIVTGDRRQQCRYGYREDSSPEVLALLDEAQGGSTEAFGDIYRLHRKRGTRSERSKASRKSSAENTLTAMHATIPASQRLGM